MDELICPHCDNEITKLRRTGNKRYSCTGCSKVVKHDLIKPYLEEDTVEVNDMRDEVGKDKSKDKDDNTQDTNEGNNVSQQSAKSEREIVTQQGKAGLEKVKKRELEDWLVDIDNVGPQTVNRITRVFETNDAISQNPNALFNYLDEELTCADQLINTLVNTVFAKEREHADLLQDQGFRPAITESGNLQLDGRQQMNGRNNQNNSNQGQQQPHQQGGQPQQQSGGGDLTREEALQMIQAAQDDDNSGSRRRGPATDALDAATEEAIQNMASNMGGLMGTAQRLLENTLMSYFEDNPEKLVENMDLIQTFMEDDTTNTSTTQETQSRSQEDEKIDSALDDIREQQGLEPNSSDSSQSTSDNNPAFREPEQDDSGAEEVVETDESSFEPDPEIVDGGGNNTETQQDAPVSKDDNWNTANGAEPDYDDEENAQNNKDSVSEVDDNDSENNQADEDDNGDDWFDKEFGEVGAEG